MDIHRKRLRYNLEQNFFLDYGLKPVKKPSNHELRSRTNLTTSILIKSIRLPPLVDLVDLVVEHLNLLSSVHAGDVLVDDGRLVTELEVAMKVVAFQKVREPATGKRKEFVQKIDSLCEKLISGEHFSSKLQFITRAAYQSLSSHHI